MNTLVFRVSGSKKFKMNRLLIVYCFILSKMFPSNNFIDVKQSYAPIVSINEINGNLLVTDYDGNLTLLNLSKEKK